MKKPWNVYRITFLLLLLVNASCQDQNKVLFERDRDTLSDLVIDSATIHAYGEYAEDNLNTVDSNSYRQKMSMDTTFYKGNNSYRLFIKFDFDSATNIIIPKKYVDVYGLDNFQVFESYIAVKIFRNEEILTDTVLLKRNFSKDLDAPLQKYGNLMFPEIRLQDKDLEIGQSISIPMTDIGVAVSGYFRLE